MRHPLLHSWLIGLCAIVSASPAPAAQEDFDSEVLIAKWTVNIEATIKLLKDQGTDEATLEQLRERTDGFTMEILKDGRFEMRSPQGEQLPGKWKVEAKEKEKVELTLTPDEEVPAITMKITVLNMNSRLQIEPPGQPAIIFDRAAEPKKSDDKDGASVLR